MEPKDVVHELRNFLQPLQYHTQALQGLKTSNATFNQSVETLSQRMQALTEFVDKVAMLSQPMNLSAMACGAADLLTSAWTRVDSPAAVKFSCEAPELPPVLCDGEWMTAALAEVLRNSVEALSDRVEPTVRATLSQTDGIIEIAIEDSGPGFREDLMPRLGEPFVSSKTGAGTGIGLALAKKVVDSHGGSMAFSNRPAGGACVRIRVPVGASK